MNGGREVINIVDCNGREGLRVHVRVEALACTEGSVRTVRASLEKAFCQEFHLIRGHDCYVLDEWLSPTWGRGDGRDDEWLYKDVCSTTGVDDKLIIERVLYEVGCAKRLLDEWVERQIRKEVDVEYVL